MKNKVINKLLIASGLVSILTLLTVAQFWQQNEEQFMQMKHVTVTEYSGNRYLPSGLSAQQRDILFLPMLMYSDLATVTLLQGELPELLDKGEWEVIESLQHELVDRYAFVRGMPKWNLGYIPIYGRIVELSNRIFDHILDFDTEFYVHAYEWAYTETAEINMAEELAAIGEDVGYNINVDKMERDIKLLFYYYTFVQALILQFPTLLVLSAFIKLRQKHKLKQSKQA